VKNDDALVVGTMDCVIPFKAPYSHSTTKVGLFLSSQAGVSGVVAAAGSNYFSCCWRLRRIDTGRYSFGHLHKRGGEASAPKNQSWFAENKGPSLKNI